MAIFLTIALTGVLTIAFIETSKWLIGKGYYAIASLGALTLIAEIWHNVTSVANTLEIKNEQSAICFGIVFILLLIAKSEIKRLNEEEIAYE